MDLRAYQSSTNAYEKLSLKDLLDARDLYHVHLMQHPNVVATAVGMYRIRRDDDYPKPWGPGIKHGTYERTLLNSEVRPYSWPCVLAFVESWVDEAQFAKTGAYNPDQLVPKTLYLPDGRSVPVCVISAPRELETSVEAPKIQYPLNNIGGGFPALTALQGREHVATIACIVSDGHKYYALTNHHVTGEPGEVLSSRLGGKQIRIGVSPPLKATRINFTEVYEGWSGKHVYVNLDTGLIEMDNMDVWSAKIRGLGVMGPLADLSVNNMTLSLIGCHVQGYGAASGVMKGEIQALFYRYKSQGGFEYVADFLIGPRSTRMVPQIDSSYDYTPTEFVTHPGDSGTLWLLEPMPKSPTEESPTEKPEKPLPMLPLAMQWGSHLLHIGATGKPRTYVLATCLSTICSRLNVDLVRDWNLDQPDTWGAVGHFSIATRTIGALSNSFPGLVQLMKANAEIISHKESTIRTSDFKGMGDDAFVPLADVPDVFWKHGKQGHSRGLEGPNHFADMDQPSTQFGGDLLTLCKNNDAFIAPDKWNDLLRFGAEFTQRRGH
jgi:hypothetical protein